MTEPQGAALPPDAASGRATSVSLLDRARNHDGDAWRRLVHLYSPLVYHWCGRQGVRPPDADDVAQEVFRVALTRLGDFRRDRPGDTFRGWLRGITRNVLLAQFRSAGRQPQAAGGSDAWQRLQEVPGPTAAADEDDPPAEVNDLYRRALELVRGEFEDRTWQAFWSVAVAGRNPAAVADDLGVTPAAVRQAKSRVLRRLKEELGDVIS
jgi:RNA polymerase sigma-70 factor (ECF subfamily)